MKSKIDVDLVDNAINFSVKTLLSQIRQIRVKIRKKEEISQAEVRLPAACAASLASIRRTLHLMGVDSFTDIDINLYKRTHTELEEASRGEFSLLDSDVG